MAVSWLIALLLGGLIAPRARARWLLSRAKHSGLAGHPRMAVAASKLVPSYSYGEDEFFGSDGAPADVVAARRDGFARLGASLRERAPKTLAATAELQGVMSDAAFVDAYRVPFQFRDVVKRQLRVGGLVEESDGPRVKDLDGNWAYDLGGAYGVNLFGAELYKGCIDRGVERARSVGVALGSYHPVIADNVRRLLAISGMEEVSFHMSGTEAVMQAIRLARYHTGRSHVVRFSGAYHGWSDSVQAGVGNPRPAPDVYTLAEMSELTLEVLRTRNDIACVLVNALQALTPNAAPFSDGTLLGSDRATRFDKAAYTEWLTKLRAVCHERGIVLIFDEVFLGFRLALGGVQEFFGVRADLVTYGKTIGGGLPVGVLCGKARWMRRFKDDRPADICFARGTFNSHPYVMATMNELLRRLDEPDLRSTYAGLERRWDERAKSLNRRLEEADCPVRVANLVSVWTTLYLRPGCYHWMFQYYLRAMGLALSWIGTGRIIFSHDLSDADFEAIATRFVAAARAMHRDGWWWHDATLTHRAIKRRVLGEMLRARLGLRPRPSAPPPREPAPTAAPAPAGVSAAVAIHPRRTSA